MSNLEKAAQYFILAVLTFLFWAIADCLQTFDGRIEALEIKQNQTIKIVVERTFDEEMRMYNYKLK